MKTRVLLFILTALALLAASRTNILPPVCTPPDVLIDPMHCGS